MDYQYPEFEVVRNADRCIGCRACERQCANEVHYYDADLGKMMCDDSKCVNCQRCVTICPTRALKIIKSDNTFRENANWTMENIKEIYKRQKNSCDSFFCGMHSCSLASISSSQLCPEWSC